jgi:hypothetical protein
MKIIYGLLVLLLSCTKSVDVQPVVKTNATYSLEKRIDGSTVRVVLEPILVCYSYKNGQIPKPCDIFVEATVYITPKLTNHLEIALTNGVDKSYIVVFPGVEKTKLRSGLSNSNNNTISYATMKLSTFKMIE